MRKLICKIIITKRMLLWRALKPLKYLILSMLAILLSMLFQTAEWQFLAISIIAGVKWIADSSSRNIKIILEERSLSMWNKPSREELAEVPAFYSTEQIPLKEKMIHMHFFLGGCDWYGAEYNPEDQIFFGFAILNNDYDMAEWGYFSLRELEELKVKFLEVDRDLHFTPKKAVEIEKIRKAERW